jgi:hypothetical protein
MGILGRKSKVNNEEFLVENFSKSTGLRRPILESLKTIGVVISAYICWTTIPSFGGFTLSNTI